MVNVKKDACFGLSWPLCAISKISSYFKNVNFLNVFQHAEKYSCRLFGWTETCILPGFHGNLFLYLDATANVSHYNIP